MQGEITNIEVDMQAIIVNNLQFPLVIIIIIVVVIVYIVIT